MSLGWGWLCMGFLMGLVLAPYVQRCLSWATDVPMWTRAPAEPEWSNRVRAALAQTTDPRRRTVLERLLRDGESALQLLADEANVSRAVALARVLGEHGGSRM